MECGATKGDVGRPNAGVPLEQRAQNVQVLDLFGEDDQLNVYAGELEVRPPPAPTIGSAAAVRELLAATSGAWRRK